MNKSQVTLTTIISFPREHPVRFWAGLIISFFLSFLIGDRYGCLNYQEKHEPILEITYPEFSFQSIPNGNKTGIYIYVENQSDARAKNVRVNFINNDGFDKYEKVKYLKGANYPVEEVSIAPRNKINDGWCPEGPAGSPAIYKNNERRYSVDIFVDWENDKGKEYALVARYESLADNFSKEIRFKRIYSYNTL